LFRLAFLAVCATIDATAVLATSTEPDGQAGPRPHRVWDANATAIAFSPDGKFLAVALDDLTVRVFEPATGKQLLTLKGHTVAVTAVAVSPDGKVLASAGCSETRPGSFELRLWNLGNGELIHQLQEKDHRSDGDGASPRPFLAFSPDGLLLALPGKDRSVHLWDVKAWKPKQSWKLGLVPSTVAFSPDGNAIAVGTYTGHNHGTVSLFDLRTGKPSPARASIYSGVLALAFSPDGKQVLGGHRHWLYRLDVGSGNYEQVWETKQQVGAISFTAGGDRVALVIDEDVELRDTKSGRTLLRLKESSRSVTFAPDGKEMATSSKDGKVKLWRTE
jgi:WD40 repeat protein